MAYGTRRDKKPAKGVRLTGLFKTKRQGLYVGGVNEEKINELIQLIKKARSAEKEITVFLWKSKYDDGPVFSLNMDLAQDRSERSGSSRPKRRPIEDDDEADNIADSEGDASDDDPFGDE